MTLEVALPSIAPFQPIQTGKTWGTELLVAHAPGLYTGKVLTRRADGKRGGLQFHARKDETFHLYRGLAVVYFVDPAGLLRRYDMVPGDSFRIPPGAIHSVQTIGDSVMFEASTPVFDDTVNVEKDFDIEKAVPTELQEMARWR